MYPPLQRPYQNPTPHHSKLRQRNQITIQKPTSSCHRTKRTTQNHPLPMLQTLQLSSYSRQRQQTRPIQPLHHMLHRLRKKKKPQLNSHTRQNQSHWSSIPIHSTIHPHLHIKQTQTTQCIQPSPQKSTQSSPPNTTQ